MSEVKLKPWIWFLGLWIASLSCTFFVVYGLKRLIKLIS